MDYGYSAAALYDGGWRSDDRNALIACYNLTNEQANAICAELKKYEEG